MNSQNEGKSDVMCTLGHASALCSVVMFSPDNQFLAGMLKDCRGTCLFDVQNGRCLIRLMKAPKHEAKNSHYQLAGLQVVTRWVLCCVLPGWQASCVGLCMQMNGDDEQNELDWSDTSIP